MPRARHGEPRFEERLVEGFAVVGDQDIKLAQVLGQPPEHGGFLAIIAHEELPQPESGGLDRSDSDQERASAGSACEAGGFGVEKRPAEGMRTRDRSGRKRLQEILWKLREIRDIDATMTAMPFPQLFRLEMLATRSLHHLARHQVLDELSVGP